MRKHLLFAGLLITVFAAQGNTESAVQFSISPSIGHTFGKTEYILDLTGYDIAESGDTVRLRVKSQLEYPLDLVMAGVSVDLTDRADPNLWSVKAGIFVSMNDPGGTMKDHDWIGFAPELTKWSYTESVPDMNSILFDFQATRRILGPGVSALVGFTYHRLEQDLFGVDGWQTPYRVVDKTTLLFRDSAFFDVPQTNQVLYYEVKYVMPQVGLQANLELSPNLSLTANAALALVWFKDVDDHPIRKKLSEADGTGAGFIASVSSRYSINSVTAAMTPFIGLSGEITTLTASGDQTQTWYGDDPASEDDDTGTSISGIPHEVNATWYHIGLNVGLAF